MTMPCGDFDRRAGFDIDAKSGARDSCRSRFGVIGLKES